MVVSLVSSIVLVGSLLFGSEIPLFSPFSTYVMPDWLAASLLVLVLIVPVVLVLRFDGLRTASLGRFVIVAAATHLLTAIFIFVFAILFVLAAYLLA